MGPRQSVLGTESGGSVGVPKRSSVMTLHSVPAAALCPGLLQRSCSLLFGDGDSLGPSVFNP